MLLPLALCALSLSAAQTDPAGAVSPPPPTAMAPEATFRREALSVALGDDGEPQFFRGDGQLPIESEEFYTRVGRADLGQNAWLRQSVRAYAPEVGWGVGILGVVAAVGIWALGEQYIPATPSQFDGLPFSESYPLLLLIGGIGGTAALVGLAIGLGAPFLMQEPPLPELKGMARAHNQQLAEKLGVDPTIVSEQAAPPVEAPAAAPTGAVTPRRADEYLTRDVESDTTVRVAVLSLDEAVSAQGALLEDNLTQAISDLDDVRGISTLALPFSREPLTTCGTEPVCLAQSAATVRAKLALGVHLLPTEGAVSVTFILVDRRGRVLHQDQVQAETLELAMNAAGQKAQELLRPLSQ